MSGDDGTAIASRDRPHPLGHAAGVFFASLTSFVVPMLIQADAYPQITGTPLPAGWLRGTLLTTVELCFALAIGVALAARLRGVSRVIAIPGLAVAMTLLLTVTPALDGAWREGRDVAPDELSQSLLSPSTALLTALYAGTFGLGAVLAGRRTEGLALMLPLAVGGLTQAAAECAPFLHVPKVRSMLGLSATSLAATVALGTVAIPSAVRLAEHARVALGVGLGPGTVEAAA